MAYANSTINFVGPMPFIPRNVENFTAYQIDMQLTVEKSSFVSICIPLLAVILLMYIIANYVTFVSQGASFQKEIEGAARILIVIAHPDDECMFFGPLITHISSTSDVYLICLSDGDYEGLGEVRSKELWKSCRKLGISNENIRMYKHDLLPDNPKSLWSPVIIGNIIGQFVETIRIDTIITFDARGVSGHSNHSAIYRAIMHLSGKRALPDYCKVYVLETVNIFRKYSLCTDLLLSYCTSQYLYVTSLERRKMILEAMNQHPSQLLWFRRLFLIFSRYSYMNSFRPIC